MKVKFMALLLRRAMALSTFILICGAFLSKVTFAVKANSPVDFGKLTLPEQMSSLDALMNKWKATPVKEPEASAQVFSLIGEITVRESMVRLNVAELKALISALVLLAEGDSYGDAGMVALDLVSVLGSAKITPIIKDLDLKGNLRRSIKTVTSGDH